MEIEHGERLLAQRPLGWKLAISTWVLLVGVGFVFFSLLGWALGAVLSRSRRMWMWTLLWAVVYGVALFISLPDDRSDAELWVFIAAWIGSTAHAAALARGVLRSRAVALAKDAAWQPGAPAQPAQPVMPTIPMPDGMPQHRGDVRDTAPPIPRPGDPQHP